MRLRNDKEGDLIYDYLKLHGKSIDELDKFSYIDQTIADGSSCFVGGVSLKKKEGTLSSRSGLASSEKFEEYKNITRDKFRELAEKIRNNEFDIKPIYFSSSDEGCAYCSFRDICFRKENQYDRKDKEEEQVNE